MTEIKAQAEKTFRVLINNQPYEISLGSLTGAFQSFFSLFHRPNPIPPYPVPGDLTLRRTLKELLFQPVEISTEFSTITGILTSVQADYVTVIEADGSTVLIRIAEIETVGRAVA